MRRNKLFIILAIITALSFFTTALTCNFCGMKLDTAPSEEESVTESPVKSEETASKETEEEAETVAEETIAEQTAEEETAEETIEEETVSEESEEEVTTANFDVVSNETGCINIGGYGGDAAYTNYIYIGDSTDGGSSSGFISFDISDIAGAEIVSAMLTMELSEEVGDDWSFLGYLRIGTIDYGTGTLRLSDGNIPANLIGQFPNTTTNIRYSSDELIDELQKK